MKLFCALALLGGSLTAAVNPQLKQVTKVYILSMNGGMDQYLADNLTKMGVFQVVTDPQSADALITDRLGEPFETKLKDLYPPPETVVAKDEKKDKNDMSGGPQFRGASSFGRGKGTFFIVDRNTRNVVWSTYAPPKDTSADQLSKTAARVIRRLRDDLTDKKQ